MKLEELINKLLSQRGEIPLDERVVNYDGTFPNKGKTNLCAACGGDPAIAKGAEAIGTAGCICGVKVGAR